MNTNTPALAVTPVLHIVFLGAREAGDDLLCASARLHAAPGPGAQRRGPALPRPSGGRRVTPKHVVGPINRQPMHRIERPGVTPDSFSVGEARSSKQGGEWR